MKKKVLIVGMMLMAIGTMGASTLKVEKEYELIPKSAYHPVINEDGTMLLYTTIDYKGLNLYKINKSEVVELSEAEGAGFAARFSKDEARVFYRTSKRENHLMMRDLRSYEIATDHSEELLPMSRDEVTITTEKEGTVVKAAGKIVAKTGSSTRAEVYGDYKEIVVDNGHEKVRISPVEGAHSYMWVSLSPNGKKILFHVPYKGLFVSEIDGKNVTAIGNGSYPTWYGDDFVVATRSKHDGYHIESSQLVAIDINTKEETELTKPQSMAEEATCAPEIGTIIYSDVNGRVNVLKVREQE